MLGVLQHSEEPVQHPGRQQPLQLHAVAAAAAAYTCRAIPLLDLHRWQQLQCTDDRNY